MDNKSENKTVENKYHNSKIYKIVCNVTKKQYIGSTCEKRLCRRLAKHVSNYRDYIKYKDEKREDRRGHYVTSFEIIANGDYDIVLLEAFKCENKDELFARERYYLERNECVNQKMPKREKHEAVELKKKYYEDNKESISLKSKDYYKTVKEKVKAQQSVRYDCECGSNIRHGEKADHERSVKHQNFLKGIVSDTYKCDCGLEVHYKWKSRHDKKHHV